MAYWTDDRALDQEQRRLDAAQADAKRKLDAAAEQPAAALQPPQEQAAVHSGKDQAG